MVKKLMLLFVVFVWTGVAPLLQAQQADISRYYTPKKGYVYLKNGRVLKGKYVYAPNLDKIRVISGRESFVFNVSEVEKVSKDKPDGVTVEKGQMPFRYKPRKVFNLNELGLLIGNSDNQVKTPVIFNTSLNYNVWKGFSLGLGSGVEIYKEAYLPIFANAMYAFQYGKRISPYVSFRGGYEIPLEGSRVKYADVWPSWSSMWVPPKDRLDMRAKGGWLIHPSVGFTYQLSEGFAMGLSVGYRYHSLRYRANDEYSMDVEYNRLSIKLGFVFN